MSVSVCLFRDNLRVADNLALWDAASSGLPVISVFVLDDATPGRWKLGGAARWWLHHSLLSLDRSLEQRGSKLVLLQGKTETEVGRLLEACPADALHIQRGHAPWDAGFERRIRALCKKTGTKFRISEDRVLFPPDRTLNSQGNPYRVFTPYWRYCLSLDPPELPVPTPDSIAAPKKWPASLRLEELNLLPEKAKWTEGLLKAWIPGEEGAQVLLRRLTKTKARRYPSDRDRPGIYGGTSRLSPHIRFGEVGVRTLWQHVAEMREGSAATSRGAEAFLRELGWREFCYHLLHHYPDLPEREFSPEFRDYPWLEDKEALRTWQRGRTGFPLVDAGMRQLRLTGWMHNRVRMVAASLLTKNLLVDWRAGQDWFWDNLVDADIANNTVNWQWIAGCGPDAAPYFRVFNPILQGKKFDPNGVYVRKYIRELRKVSDEHIHEPRTKERVWIVPSSAYPKGWYPVPMVSLKETRMQALAIHARLVKGQKP